MSLLTPGQTKFAGVLAAETGLDPRVVGSWLLAEQSGSAAKNYEGRGYHNWLNIANTDSGPAPGAHSSVWHDPVTAAKVTAEWLKGKGQIAHEYGQPASGIRAILGAHDPMQQIDRIAKSGWASSGYHGGNDLRQLYGQLAGQSVPVAHEAIAHSQYGDKAPIPVVDNQAFASALRRSQESSQVASLFGGRGPGDVALRQALSIPRPLPQEFLRSGPEPHAERRMGSHVEGSSKGTQLGGFLPKGAEAKIERIDQGQDIKTNPGGHLIAPGDFEIIGVKNNPGGFGERYPIVKFFNGRFAGKTMYLGHTHTELPVGHRGKAGEPISKTGFGTPAEGNARTPGWAEIGEWGPNGPGGMNAGAKIAPLFK